MLYKQPAILGTSMKTAVWLFGIVYVDGMIHVLALYSFIIVLLSFYY